MTIRDFFKLVWHYRALFLAIVIACSLAGGVFGLIKVRGDQESTAIQRKNYESAIQQSMACSTLLISSSVNGVGGVAQAQASAWNQANNSDYSEWLLAKSEWQQELLAESSSSTAKSKIGTAPGAWLKTEFAKDFSDLTIVESQILQDSNTVLIVAIGPDPQLCIEAANTVAEDTISVAYDLYGKNSKTSDDLTLSLGIDNNVVLKEYGINIEFVAANEVTSAYPLLENDLLSTLSSSISSSDDSDEGSPSLKAFFKYLIVGFVGGVFLAIVVLLLIDFVRKPIKNVTEIAGVLEVPVVADYNNGANIDMVIENIKLVAGPDMSRICIASISDSDFPEKLIGEIEKKSRDTTQEFISGGSLTASANAVASAASSDGLILCVREWRDSVFELDSAINELAIANAKIIGLAMLE